MTDPDPAPAKTGGTIEERQADAVFDIADSGFDSAELGELQVQLFGPDTDDDPSSVSAAGPPGDGPIEAVEPVDEPDADEDDAGTPDAPQPCQYGEDHPAVRSLLYADDDGQAYVPVCDEHDQEARDDMDGEGDKILGVVDIDPTAEPEPVPVGETVMAAAPPDPDLDEDGPMEVGMPDAPQPCWSPDVDEHPAVRSLLYAGDAEYLPVCAEHDQAGRDLIEAEGEGISRVVDIREPDRLDAEEQDISSRTADRA